MVTKLQNMDVWMTKSKNIFFTLPVFSADKTMFNDF